jgi:hypothetical protein
MIKTTLILVGFRAESRRFNDVFEIVFPWLHGGWNASFQVRFQPFARWFPACRSADFQAA